MVHAIVVNVECEMVLHVGQVPMLVYIIIKLKNHLSDHLQFQWHPTSFSPANARSKVILHQTKHSPSKNYINEASNCCHLSSTKL